MVVFVVVTLYFDPGGCQKSELVTLVLRSRAAEKDDREEKVK